MKKIIVLILALIMVLGLVGCSSVPTEEATSTPQPTEEATQIPEPMPEPTEKTIEVEDDIVVTFDDFKKILNDKKVSYSLDFDKVFMLMEAEDGFSFKCDDGRIEKISIFGNTDKNENLTSIKIVCGGVIVDWIEGKKEIEDFHERYMKADFMSMDSVQLSAFSGTYDAIRMLGIVYELITSQYTDGFDAAIVLLTTDNPVQIGKWSVSTVADKDNYTVTIEAKYNK